MKNSLKTKTRYSKGSSSTKKHTILDRQQIVNNGINKCVEIWLLIHEIKPYMSNIWNKTYPNQ